MKPHLISILMVGMYVIIFTSPAIAEGPFEPLKEDDVTIHKIKTFFDAAFLKANIDEDGDLKVEDGRTKVFVKVDSGKKLITFFAVWPLKASVSEEKKLKLINTMNDDLIFARFAMPNPTTLWCDYQLLYEGGVTPYAIVNNYKLLREVCIGAVLQKDPEDIIGRD